ncbi:uncharacterized protein SCDLUD_001563 [Saccharomycodes ludwigii]|uniref:uncharacterized protein n=1 Tax=Saccharomycodes ludwigii TaxID=36035 RepID=UPI001E86B6C8|nr:hypothetical protein SCDLUD_001563 [Saccharomycodes ludwigii]KAH3901784.1 hypothetical protein SCDLUD_001563 [Saccharomycodes ludwigii]
MAKNNLPSSQLVELKIHISNIHCDKCKTAILTKLKENHNIKSYIVPTSFTTKNATNTHKLKNIIRNGRLIPNLSYPSHFLKHCTGGKSIKANTSVLPFIYSIDIVEDDWLSIIGMANPVFLQNDNFVFEIVEILREIGYIPDNISMVPYGPDNGTVGTNKEAKNNKNSKTKTNKNFELFNEKTFEIPSSPKADENDSDTNSDIVKSHYKFCKVCQDTMLPVMDNVNTGVESYQQKTQMTHYKLKFSIQGMTCSNCSKSIASALSEMFTDKYGNTHSYELDKKVKLLAMNINSVNNLAEIEIETNFGLQNADSNRNNEIIQNIETVVEDLGYQGQLMQIYDCGTAEPKGNIADGSNPIDQYRLVAAIGGITCAACAATITNVCAELDFIKDISVNIVSKTGTFILRFAADEQAEKLKVLQETIEDCGFDFEILTPVTKIKKSTIAATTDTIGSKVSVPRRTFEIEISGIYCSNCPIRIMNVLKTPEYQINILESDLQTSTYSKKCKIKFDYQPQNIDGAKNNVTIRTIILDKLSKELQLNVKVVENESIEEHLNRLAKLETYNIGVYLLITFSIVIPTFIFGVVGMSLLAKTNPFYKWLEETLPHTNTSRVIWILFILSTPVYFYIDKIFHMKAIKEILMIWKFGGSSTWSKKFFKFGSMNLLMSLGTSVSYIASLGLLIANNVTKKNDAASNKSSMDTYYFDSVVFLTFFLLIGRLLESFSKCKAASSINELSKFKSDSALLKSTMEEINPLYLEIGDKIIVKNGESPPLDCKLLSYDYTDKNNKGATATSDANNSSNSINITDNDANNVEFDESCLTGESTPIIHIPGDVIYAGTINISGKPIILTPITTIEKNDSLLDQIISSVRDGQMNSPKIVQTADKITSIFVPLIILLAILTWIIWILITKINKNFIINSSTSSDSDISTGNAIVWSLNFAISVFVIACPCGIGLAAPTAMFVGSGIAAKNGILVKGGGHAFQQGSKINVVCFDKTGTLTLGGGKNFQVTNYCIDPKYEDEVTGGSREIGVKDIWGMIDKLESNSTHPLSIAIRNFLEQKLEMVQQKDSDGEMNPNYELLDSQEIPGCGLMGVFKNNRLKSGDTGNNKFTLLIGNEKFMHKQKEPGQITIISEKHQKMLETWKTQGKSIVVVSMLQQMKGANFITPILYFSIRDTIRPEAKYIINRLQNNFKIETWLISGDNEVTTKAIAKEVGIPVENVIAGVLPEEKAKAIESIRNGSIYTKKSANIAKPVICMVGDGINDAPALSIADVGVAMATGSDLAMTSSDFVLLSTDTNSSRNGSNGNMLYSLLTLIELSRKVFNRVKFNFCWALVYNMIGIPIAAGVLFPYKKTRLSPVWASCCMALSSVSVVLSSLLLKLYKPRRKKIISNKFKRSTEDNEPNVDDIEMFEPEKEAF